MDNEPFFFGTHPKPRDREKSFTKMNARNKTPVGGDLGAERFHGVNTVTWDRDFDLELVIRWIESEDRALISHGRQGGGVASPETS